MFALCIDNAVFCFVFTKTGLVKTLLGSYAKVSGYKINKGKSVLVGICLSDEQRHMTDTVSKAKWKTEVKCLGSKPSSLP